VGKGGITTPNSWAMTPKPGAIIGPHAPTTAVSIQMINSIKSFFHRGQFKGSRGESLGCGTRMISLSLPVPCFKCAVPETKPGISVNPETWRIAVAKGGVPSCKLSRFRAARTLARGAVPGTCSKCLSSRTPRPISNLRLTLGGVKSGEPKSGESGDNKLRSKRRGGHPPPNCRVGITRPRSQMENHPLAFSNGETGEIAALEDPSRVDASHCRPKPPGAPKGGKSSAVRVMGNPAYRRRFFHWTALLADGPQIRGR
jgi:hypothetical protein